MSISSRYHDSASVYDLDERLSEESGSCLKSISKDNARKLRKLKEVKTLINFYTEARDYKKKIEDEGILSPILNKIIEQLLDQVKSQYIGSIIEKIEIQTHIRRKEEYVELNSNIDLKPLLKPYLQFTIEINEIESYSIRFTFQSKTTRYVKANVH